MTSWQKVLNMIGPEGPTGSSGHSGTFTANGTTPVVIADTNVLDASTIIITRNTSFMVLAPPAYVCQLIPNTGFAIVNIVEDDSSYNYRIL